ncbi:FkbM family methyltransferase [Pseudonocardiaceae bacterium YIM PH 21723]|nr:FkbM family methyltransferase [Pseudonocardiaceae bacterium YIM PH 21723]
MQLTVCTVASVAQLPQVRVLRESLLAAHRQPDTRLRFLVLLADGTADQRSSGVLTPADIGIPAGELATLATSYTEAQLRAVLQPLLLAHLVDTEHHVLYLDPSVFVLGPFADHIAEALDDHPVVLLPRVLEPLPRDGLRPTPEDLREVGTFDPGFLAVAAGAEPFLRTLAGQLRQSPDEYGPILDGAPALTEHHVLRQPGIGLSVWNALQRPVHRGADGGITVADHPLATMHFEGFDSRRPWLLSATMADRPRVLLSRNPVLAQLCAAYSEELGRADIVDSLPYRFGALPEGTPIPLSLRRRHARETLNASAPPAAFGAPEQVRAFIAWAAEPDGPDTRLSRWVSALLEDHPEIGSRFPEPEGADRKEFRRWCLTDGGVPEPAVPAPEPDQAALLDQLGVAVIGDNRTAETLRAVVRATGLPTADQPSYPVVLVCDHRLPVPPERHVVQVIGSSSADGSVPVADWAERGVSEVWVGSDAARLALRKELRSELPIRTVRLPILDRGAIGLPARKAALARIGLDDEVVFVSTVDHRAEVQHNALGVVSAFRTAFPDRDDVRLIFLVTGARYSPEAAERLRLATAADKRVGLLEEASDTERATVFEAASCLVSLHRDGGAGTDVLAARLAEVAGTGLTVVAARHGATAELLAGTGALLVAVPAGQPDVAAAARFMAEVADDPDTARETGLRTRQALLDIRPVSSAAKQLRELVEHAYQGWKASRMPAPGPDADPLRALVKARHALLRQPNVDASYRTPMAPALRKAVLRVLQHYDTHLREVMNSLMDGVETATHELIRRQQQLVPEDFADRDAVLEAVRLELANIAARQVELSAPPDLAPLEKRTLAVEQLLAQEVVQRGEQVEELSNRVDQLTSVLELTLGRLEQAESRLATVGENMLSAPPAHTTNGHGPGHGNDKALAMANQAMRTVDSLRRVVVQEHQRTIGEPDPGASTVLCDAGLLRLPAEDNLMLPLLSSNGVWEPEVAGLIDSVIEPDGIFVDVGAHVGYHTIRVLSRIGNSGAVLAVEPDPRCLELLRHNVHTNVAQPMQARFAVVEGAAWDAPGQLSISASLRGGVQVSPLPASVEGQPAVAGALAKTVSAVRLDQELESLPELSGMRVSVIRVAVPGVAHRALGGMVRLLRKDKPNVVVCFDPAGMTALGDEPIAALREFGTWGYDLLPVSGERALTPEEVMELSDGRSMTLWLQPRGR